MVGKTVAGKSTKSWITQLGVNDANAVLLLCNVAMPSSALGILCSTEFFYNRPTNCSDY